MHIFSIVKTILIIYIRHYLQKIKHNKFGLILTIQDTFTIMKLFLLILNYLNSDSNIYYYLNEK